MSGAGPPSKYTVPEWSTPPKFECSLEVIQSGVLVETIDLSTRAWYVLGRDAQTKVLGTTASRQHVALQFGEGGELYVVDLGSAHGSKVNKTALVPWQFTLMPVGSILQLGTSSRSYVLQGPDELRGAELESADLAAKRALVKQRQAAPSRGAVATAARTQADAGVDATAAEQRLLDDVEDMELTAATIHPNDAGLFSKVTAKRAALTRARAQEETLLRKQASAAKAGPRGSFTDGQAAALQGVRAQVEALGDQVAAAEEAVRDRMRSRRRGAPRSAAAGEGGGEFTARVGHRAINEGSRAETMALAASGGDFDDEGVPTGGTAAVKRQTWAGKALSIKGSGISGLGKGKAAHGTLSFLRKGLGAKHVAPAPASAAPVALSSVESAGTLSAKLQGVQQELTLARAALVSATQHAATATAGARGGDAVDVIQQQGDIDMAQSALKQAGTEVKRLEAAQKYLQSMLQVAGGPQALQLAQRQQAAAPLPSQQPQPTTAPAPAAAPPPSPPGSPPRPPAPAPVPAPAPPTAVPSTSGTAQGTAAEPNPSPAKKEVDTSATIPPAPAVGGHKRAAAAPAPPAKKRPRRSRDVDIHYEDEEG